MAEVVLEHLTKIFPGGVRAVENCSLRVAEGEFLVLVGPSGCGKSTLLRMIAGLEESTAGTIRIGAQVVDSLPPKDRDVAMVFQNYALYPHMTVFDNMAFGLKLRRTSKPVIRERVQEAARILGIEQLLQRRPKALSGGQRQRVAVGRAIVRQPAVFLFDEPLSNLDALLRVEMRKELSALHRRLRATMIYVTHDQVEAMTLGNRIAVMNDGLLQQVGEPLEVYQRPSNRFVAGFLGTPPMNFLNGRIAEGDAGLTFQLGAHAWPLPQALTRRFPAAKAPSVTTLGIRPEHLHLDELSAGETSTKRGVSFEADFDGMQTLGAESLVYVNVDGQPLIARLQPRMLSGHPARLALAADLGQAHLFDSSGNNVSLLRD